LCRWGARKSGEKQRTKSLTIRASSAKGHPGLLRSPQGDEKGWGIIGSGQNGGVGFAPLLGEKTDQGVEERKTRIHYVMGQTRERHRNAKKNIISLISPPRSARKDHPKVCRRRALQEKEKKKERRKDVRRRREERPERGEAITIKSTQNKKDKEKVQLYHGGKKKSVLVSAGDRG